MEVTLLGEEGIRDSYLRKKIGIPGLSVSSLRAGRAYINPRFFARAIGQFLRKGVMSAVIVLAAYIIQVVGIGVAVTNLKTKGKLTGKIILDPRSVWDGKSCC